MTEKEIEQKFKADFRALFPKLKGATAVPIASLAKDSSQRGRLGDIILCLRVRGKTKNLFCEVVSQRYPKQLREKGLQLLEISQRGRKGYPVIIAPYISEFGREICKKIGVGFLDLSGNAYLDFNSFYMEIEGKPNKFKYPSEPTGLFNPKAERILRFYLLKVSRKEESGDGYRNIAKEVGVSLGQLSKVNKKLDEFGLWLEQPQGSKIIDKKKLLDLWSENYRSERNQVLNLYSIMQVSQIEKQLAEFCKTKKIQYALTLFSGANRLAPFTRYNFATSYFSGDVNQLKRDLELREVPTGANFQILMPYDEGVYYKADEVDSVRVANPIQIYLDLYNYAGRGREQADFLREKIIKF
ncbi:MAG: type IV toxin-antitoxin system AbiEi family antitoxin [Deltaproteobacteria bacterium]|nr:type IV toxin-antitoxin system AbiEi family antitoxin [Deltaproteobacteria bacterium]